MSNLTNQNENDVPAEKPSLGAFWQSPWVETAGRFLALVVVFVLFCALVGPTFYSARNLENILRQSAVYATASLGMTMVIITAGIDLSVGSIIALTVVVVAWTLNLNYEVVSGGETQVVYLVDQYPRLMPLLAMLCGLTAATLAGLLNGVTIVWMRLVPFIVTLGTMGIVRGLAEGLAKERDVYPHDPTWLADILDPTITAKDPTFGSLLLPLGVWILLLSAVAAAFLLRYTRFGRHVFAIGSNEETARLCGVAVGRTKIVVYTLAGFFGGLAGLMYFSQIGGFGTPSAAVAYELYVIAAVVIGGGSLMGGQGSILGSMIGALIITVLYMGGEQAGWPKWVQKIVIGAIIVAAVKIDQMRRANTR
ncbi:MAG: ABC transporter permease [Planctomycetota bacterium]|nr:MAG: ABC transporter permease [Planctomycetota bacterium]